METVVQVQNQAGPHKNKWDVSGTVVEALGFDSYNVRMDGSGRVTRRNRRFLWPIVPYSRVLAEQSAPQDTVDTVTDVQEGGVNHGNDVRSSGVRVPAGVPGSGVHSGAGHDGQVQGELSGGGPLTSATMPLANAGSSTPLLGKTQDRRLTHALSSPAYNLRPRKVHFSAAAAVKP